MSIYIINQSLSQNLTRLLDFDSSTHIYDDIKLYLLQHNEIILQKLPEFYRKFLKEPSKFKEFLDAIYEECLTYNSDNYIYKDINVLTCMCCAVFHLTKLYVMLNRVYTDYQHVLQDAAHYYHLPLGTWIYNLIVNRPYKQIHRTTSANTACSSNTAVSCVTFNNAISTYDDKIAFLIQHSKYKFANTFQYLLLMSYVSKELKISDRPLFKYLEAIYKIFDHNPVELFDPIDDILKVLVADEMVYNIDIYHFHFKLQYTLNKNRIETTHSEVVNYSYYVEKYSELNFDNIFINNSYNIIRYIKPKLHLRNLFYNYYKADLSSHKLPLFVLFELMFDLTESYTVVNNAMRYYEVELNDKWSYFCNKLYQFLMHSEDLEADFTFIIYSLGGNINYNHWFTTHDNIYKRDETLLFAVVQNMHFEKNALFIHKLLKAIITKDFSKFPKYMMKKMKGMSSISYNDSQLIYKKNEHNMDILLLLLDRVFKKNMLSRSIQIASSMLKNNIRTFIATSFDDDQLKYVFKDVIQLLLENCKNLKNEEYISMLYQYEDSLKEIGINLAKYNSYYMSLLARKIVCCILICK